MILQRKKEIRVYKSDVKVIKGKKSTQIRKVSTGKCVKQIIARTSKQGGTNPRGDS